MRANPRSVPCNIAQQRIKRAAGPALVDRIDPYEHPVRREELFARLVREFLGIDRGRRADARRIQFGRSGCSVA